jgi:predicted transcriptional regulator
LAEDGLRDQIIFAMLADGPRTVTELEALTGVAAHSIRRSLRALREEACVVQQGSKGRHTLYQRVR